MKISEREWAVLAVLWKVQPANARQVRAVLQERYGWAYSTVKTMLVRLEKKGLVQSEMLGNVAVYTATSSERSARLAAWKGFVGKVFGGRTGTALQFLSEAAGLADDERQVLEAMIDTLDE